MLGCDAAESDVRGRCVVVLLSDDLLQAVTASAMATIKPRRRRRFMSITCHEKEETLAEAHKSYRRAHATRAYP